MGGGVGLVVLLELYCNPMTVCVVGIRELSMNWLSMLMTVSCGCVCSQRCSGVLNVL